MENDEILMLWEVVEQYDKEGYKEENKDTWCKAYPTEQHKKEKKYWWFSYIEIMHHSDFKKEEAKIISQIIWGK